MTVVRFLRGFLRTTTMLQEVVGRQQQVSNDIPLFIVPPVISGCSSLSSLSVMVGTERILLVLLHLYEEYISQEWYQPWDSFIWIAGELYVLSLGGSVCVCVGVCVCVRS